VAESTSLQTLFAKKASLEANKSQLLDLKTSLLSDIVATDQKIYAIDLQLNSINGHINTVNAQPTLSLVTPNALKVETATAPTLTVTGTEFSSGDTTVLLNGTEQATTVVTPESATCLVPISMLTSPGNIRVAVKTNEPGGGISAYLDVPVSYGEPTLLTLTPSSIDAGSSDTSIVLSGTNFYQNVTEVLVNNVVKSVNVFTSQESLTIVLTAQELVSVGSILISVRTPTPGGGSSDTLTLIVSSND
jgi:hypothetical protein